LAPDAAPSSRLTDAGRGRCPWRPTRSYARKATIDGSGRRDGARGRDVSVFRWSDGAARRKIAVRAWIVAQNHSCQGSLPHGRLTAQGTLRWVISSAARLASPIGDSRSAGRMPRFRRPCRRIAPIQRAGHSLGRRSSGDDLSGGGAGVAVGHGAAAVAVDSSVYCRRRSRPRFSEAWRLRG
jgi:hypothetical protein